MANLTQFLGLTASTGASSLTVFPADRGDSVQNGGRCCNYIIDGSTTRVNVELWGGGGDGNGACCCQWPYAMPAPGQYVSKTFTVVSGDSLTICAAGSGCCSPNCCGTQGLPSYVNKNGSTQAYAYGGHGGCALCFYKNFNCTGICHPGCTRRDNGTGDLVYCTYAGMSATHSFCATGHFETAAGSPKYSQNMRIGLSSCSGSWTNTGCCRLCNHFPGGGGGGGSSCGGPCCWGGWGAGGMVILTFYG
jgi:hypothetical protein